MTKKRVSRVTILKTDNFKFGDKKFLKDFMIDANASSSYYYIKITIRTSFIVLNLVYKFVHYCRRYVL